MTHSKEAVHVSMPTMILEHSETKLWGGCIIFCGRRMHSGVDVTEEIGTFWLGLYVSSQYARSSCQNSLWNKPLVSTKDWTDFRFMLMETRIAAG
jgi:hypothetical protein